MDIFSIKYNVKSYENCIDFHDSYKITFFEEVFSLENFSPQNIFFLFETVYSEIFGHWVYECAIFLPLFIELKKQYKNLKLLIKEEKRFKNLFFNYFKIDSNDILLGNSLFEKRSDSSPYKCIQNIPSQNMCFIVNPISRFNDKSITQTYKDLLTSFFKYFKVPIQETFYEKDFLLMERGTKENYAILDRQINFENIKDELTSKKFIYKCFNSDDCDSLIFQINTVNSTSKNIVIVDGSAFQVNGMFVENKNIFIVNSDKYFHDMTKTQEEIFPKYKFLHDCIKDINNNKIFYFNQNDPLPLYLKNQCRRSYISNNCIGALIFKNFNQEYSNPFISHLILDDLKFVTLCKNFDKYMKISPIIGTRNLNSKWCQITKKEKFDDHDCPILNLDDLELHFIHDNDSNEVLEKFKRRQTRYNSKIVKNIFLFNFFTLFQDHTPTELFELLKIFLQHEHTSICLLPYDLPECIYDLCNTNKRNITIKMNNSTKDIKRNKYNYNLQDTPDKREKFIEILLDAF